MTKALGIALFICAALLYYMYGQNEKYISELAIYKQVAEENKKTIDALQRSLETNDKLSTKLDDFVTETNKIQKVQGEKLYAILKNSQEAIAWFDAIIPADIASQLRKDTNSGIQSESAGSATSVTTKK